jgi:hypothetical protein
MGVPQQAGGWKMKHRWRFSADRITLRRDDLLWLPYFGSGRSGMRPLCAAHVRNLTRRADEVTVLHGAVGREDEDFGSAHVILDVVDRVDLHREPHREGAAGQDKTRDIRVGPDFGDLVHSVALNSDSFRVPSMRRFPVFKSVIS